MYVFIVRFCHRFLGVTFSRHFLSRYNFRILPHVQQHIKYCSKKLICFRGYTQRFLLSELVYVNKSLTINLKLP